ncbi:MAG: hypothetical protein IPM43_01940 [Actinomycetota bacterium]|nr:MAG: hypothetical protein IPM43_01940 [Actinomycetota bacterium]
MIRWIAAALVVFIGGVINDPADYQADLNVIAEVPAVRGTVVQVTPTAPPPAPPNLRLDGPCDEMNLYRVVVGLPEQFNALGYRESRCLNTVTSPSGCCVGWWQLHYVIFRDHRMIGPLAECGATWTNIIGDDPDSKMRQACAAKALFDVAGYDPWALS